MLFTFIKVHFHITFNIILQSVLNVHQNGTKSIKNSIQFLHTRNLAVYFFKCVGKTPNISRKKQFKNRNIADIRGRFFFTIFLSGLDFNENKFEFKQPTNIFVEWRRYKPRKFRNLRPLPSHFTCDAVSRGSSRLFGWTLLFRADRGREVEMGAARTEWYCLPVLFWMTENYPFLIWRALFS